MAKGKNKSGGNNNGGVNNNDNNNNGGGGEYLNVVMKVDFHCDGCKQRIRKLVRSFPDVCAVELEGENTVKIVALKSMDFVNLRDKLSQKMVKNVELISPKPPKPIPGKIDSASDKPKALPLTTVVLKLPYHCHGCWTTSHKVLRSYKGVFEVLLDKEKDLVIVKGQVDGKKMVEYANKKLKKTVEIVPEKKSQKDKKDGGEKEGEKKKDGDGGKGEMIMVHPWAVLGRQFEYGSLGMVHAPQMFSDENPNACSIM